MISGIIGGIVAFILIVVLAIGGVFVYRAWYVDTHCTMVVGTQVCQ